MKYLMLFFCLFLNATSFASTLMSVAQNQDRPCFTATDGKNVYWTSLWQGEIKSASVDGGPVTVIANGKRPNQIRVADGYVYWPDELAGTISKYSTTDGSLSVLADKQNSPYELFIYKDYVYWTNIGPLLDENDQPVYRVGSVRRMPITGGRVEILADKQTPGGLAVANDTVFWVNFSETGRDTLESLQLSTLRKKTIVENGSELTNRLSVDAENLYWTDYRAGTISRMRLSDGDIGVLVTGQYSVTNYDIHSDGKFLYWTLNLSDRPLVGRVVRVPITGGNPEVFADLSSEQFGLSSDGKNLYWSDFLKGIIYKQEK